MIFLFVLTAILAILIVKQHLKSRRLPPGPYCFPVIGNIPQLVYFVWREKGVVPAFDHLRREYGNIFTLWLGPFPHVSITNFDANHDVFVKNGNNYKDRDLIPFVKEYSQGHGFFGSNGENFEEIRKFTLRTFRDMGVGRDVMEEKIMNELDARCVEIDSQAVDGMSIVSSAEFFDLTVGSVINSLLVGKRFDDSNKDEFLHLRELMARASETFTLFDNTVPVWILKKLFPERYESNVGTQMKVGDFVSRDAGKRWNGLKAGTYSIDPENPQDFLDAFLAKMNEENHHPAYSMAALKIVLGDLWGAGHDTTSMTLITGFNQLVHHPEITEKVREELMKVTDNGSRSLSLQDRATTHYFNATLAEIQRHASVLNVAFWKNTSETTTVSGYTLDAETLITAQLGAFHTNETVFRNPQEFRPERFLENEKLLSQLIPFGIGKRSCVGEHLARAELYLFMGNLLLRYDLKPHGPYPSIVDQLPYSAGKVPDKSGKLEFRRF